MNFFIGRKHAFNVPADTFLKLMLNLRLFLSLLHVKKVNKNAQFCFVPVREKIGPIATPDFIQNAPGLPKTRSGNGHTKFFSPHALPLHGNSCRHFLLLLSIKGRS